MSTSEVSTAKSWLTDVLNRVAETIHATKENEVAKALDVSPSTLSTWRARGTMPYEQLAEFARAKGLNVLWLLHGDEPMQLNGALGTRDSGSGTYAAALDPKLLEIVIAAIDEARADLEPAKKAAAIVALYELMKGSAIKPERATLLQFIRNVA